MGSFPLIRQHDSMECGITCLAMVRKFFRMKYSIDIFLEFALQPQKESHYLVLMKQLYNLRLPMVKSGNGLVTELLPKSAYSCSF